VNTAPAQRIEIVSKNSLHNEIKPGEIALLGNEGSREGPGRPKHHNAKKDVCAATTDVSRFV
jgi:hypothetical protein